MSAPTQVRYVDMENPRNNSLPADLLLNPINIYALWTKRCDHDAWELRYIGQRSVRTGWRRVSEHLFWKHHRTQSKLDEVLNEVRGGSIIGVTGIRVEPDSLRLAIEEELIGWCSLQETFGSLWNKKGRRKVASL
jgi:hypothetical protein